MSHSYETTYFDVEGRDNVHACLDLAINASRFHRAETLIVFTATGAGPQYVADKYLLEDEFQTLKVVAVTPPVGREYRIKPGDKSSPLVSAGIPPVVRDELASLGVQVVSAHLPFKEIHDGRERRSEWSRVAEAYGVLGGGFALCVQSLLVATDAGVVVPCEKVVVASADTAFVAYASRTETFLSPYSGLIVEHIICRPLRYDISRREHYLFHVEPEPVDSTPLLADGESEDDNDSG